LKPTPTILRSLRDAGIALTGITPIVAQRRPMVDVDFSPRTRLRLPIQPSIGDPERHRLSYAVGQYGGVRTLGAFHA
jgi:hypothetical protein